MLLNNSFSQVAEHFWELTKNSCHLKYHQKKNIRLFQSSLTIFKRLDLSWSNHKTQFCHTGMIKTYFDVEKLNKIYVNFEFRIYTGATRLFCLTSGVLQLYRAISASRA